MGCGSSKSTAVHPTKAQHNGLPQKTDKPNSEKIIETTTTTNQNGVTGHITAKDDSNTDKTILVKDHSESRISNGQAVTSVENNKENVPNSRTPNPEHTSTKTERRQSHTGVAFEVKFGDENTNLRTQRRPPKLKKLEHVPILTAEMLAQKLALAEANRQKEIEKKLAKTSKRKKKLLEARELDKAAQAKRLELEEKMNAQNRKRARAQAEIIEKQKRREMKAKRVRERAQRIKEGGEGADFEIDPDETYNADEENESWDNMETNDTITVSSASSTRRKQSKPTLDSDDEPEQNPRAVHDFFEE